MLMNTKLPKFRYIQQTLLQVCFWRSKKLSARPQPECSRVERSCLWKTATFAGAPSFRCRDHHLQVINSIITIIVDCQPSSGKLLTVNHYHYNHRWSLHPASAPAFIGGRVAEVARGHGGPPPKSLDPDENFKPKHTLFCLELRFVAIYALFGDLWAKKVPFWVKNSVSWARSALLHGIYCIFHWVNFANLRLRAKTTHLTRKL